MPQTENMKKGRKAPLVLAAAALLGASGLSAPILLDRPAVAASSAAQMVSQSAPAKGFADLVEQVQPAVVSVKVKVDQSKKSSGMERGFGKMPSFPKGHPLEKFFDQFGGGDDERFKMPRRRGSAQGSGFVISKDGYVVTNNHVVDGADEVTLTFTDGKEHKARVIGTDKKTDLALLKIDAKGKTFKYVEFAENDARVGDWVVAVGNPFGLGGTVTTGIVSARGRDIGSGPYDDFLQIDAAINRGNSGGPAFNLNGKVVGVNTAIFSPSGGNVGIGFAIPSNIVNDVIADLKDDGKVTRGWLGVHIQPVSQDIAEGLGLDDTAGTLVAEVQENSPAYSAGLKAGDTILTMNGDEVEGPRDLAKKVAKLAPGSKAKFEIVRSGEEITKTVKLRTLPGAKKMASAGAPDEADESTLEGLGLAVAPGDGDGVNVVDIDPDSEAASKGMRVGDRILKIGGKSVNDPEDVRKALDAASEKGHKNVLMLIRSGDSQRFIALPLKSA
ncbi:MAG: Do family serine endopeptidase [Hyphomicrobiales bacterium]